MSGRESTAVHHTPCHTQVARCAMLCGDHAAALLETESCHHADVHHTNGSAKALFSKARFFNICCLSSRRKDLFPVSPRLNATVKSWQKIRVTTTLSKKVTGMNSRRANFYFKDNHPTPVSGKTKH